MRFGIIDESAPEIAGGRVVYTVGLAVIDERDLVRISERLVALLDRRRPFHWEDEGRVTRERFVGELATLPIGIHVGAVVVDRSHQQGARSRLLGEEILNRATAGRSASLVIEQRSQREDQRDRQEIRSWFRDRRLTFGGIEHVPKSHPLAWIADAAAGMWSDVLLDRGAGYVEHLASAERLRSAVVLDP